jgi:hypothetical protein
VQQPRLLYRRVVLTLVLLRSNMSQTLLADLFGISQPTVSRIYRAMLPLIERSPACTDHPYPKYYADEWCWSTAP